MRVCTNYKKLNELTQHNYYLLPLQDRILEEMSIQEVYSFLHGFSVYNKIFIALEDKLKMTFITKWGKFVYKVMPFGLFNSPSTFQCFVSTRFQEYLKAWLKIFMDALCLHSSTATHLDKL